MLQLVKLGKHFQGRELFHNVDWQVKDGERVGLTGPNGSGKTTLLRLLSGEMSPDEGSVVVPRGTTIGYLPQDGLYTSGRPLFEETRSAFAALIAMDTERAAAEQALADMPHDDPGYLDLVGRYGDLERQFREGGGFEIDAKTSTVLQGLGFSTADFAKDCDQFSGGWQMRIALAKLLLARPNLLLLDEPTNHLDIEARGWLESFLATYPFSVILVSHDRHFLDAVVQKITEVSPQGLLDFTGGYSRYVVLREEHHQRIANHNRRIREEVARLTDLADRFGAKATKAAQAQGWRKQAEKLAAELIPEIPPRDTIHFRFPPAPHSGKTALTLEGVGKSYGDKLVFKDVNLVVNRGERVALVGVNGAGKSTLMRILAGQEPHQGKVLPGHLVQMSYFAQDQARVLDPAKTVLDEATTGAPYEIIPRLRSLLGAFLFSGDDVAKPVRVLSGGERNRLALVKLLLKSANLLLLDEPTNHLDLDSKDVLLEALQQFEGTVVFVSHDRYFLEQLATKVVEVGDGKVEMYPSTYAEYQWKLAQTANTNSAPAGQAMPQSDAPHVEINQDKATRIADREAKKLQERERKQQEKRVAEIENRITVLEGEVARIETSLSDPEIYSNSDEALRLTRELTEQKAALETAMAQWEDAQSALMA